MRLATFILAYFALVQGEIPLKQLKRAGEHLVLLTKF